MTAGTVVQFDRAAAEAWEKLAGVLREAKPGAAAGWLEEMADRRHQADAELRIARTLRGAMMDDYAKLLTRVAHTEAAMKIDPTCEEAAVEHLTGLGEACFCAATVEKARTDGEMEELAARTLVAAVQYLDRFDATANRAAAYEACRLAVHLGVGDIYFNGLFSQGGIQWTPRRLQMVDNAQRILEDSVKHSVALGYQDMMLTIVGRTMRHRGVPLAQRQQWVDGILQECVRGEKAKTVPTGGPHCDLWLCAAELAFEDGSAGRAKELFAQMLDRLDSDRANWGLSSNFHARAVKLLERMDDAAVLAAWNRRIKEVQDQQAQVLLRLQIHWPEIMPVRDSHGNVIPDGLDAVPSLLLRQAAEPGGFGRSSRPLAAGDQRLYVLMDKAEIPWGQFDEGAGRRQPPANLRVAAVGQGGPSDRADS